MTPNPSKHIDWNLYCYPPMWEKTQLTETLARTLMIKKKRLRKNADKHDELENTFQDIETWLGSITDENIPYSEEYNGVDSHLWKSICLSQVIIEITVLRSMLPEYTEDDVDPVEWDITLIDKNVGSQMSTSYDTKSQVEEAVSRLKELFEYNYHIDYENCVKYFLDSYSKNPCV